MRVLRGKKITYEEDIHKLVKGYDSVLVDIGTGDGRFVYKLAQKRPKEFFIGLDPVAEMMTEYSSKSIKKLTKGGLANLLYLIASVEEIPKEIYNIANHISINLPWGSLLAGIVKGDPTVLQNIVNMAAPLGATLKIRFTYSFIYESGEIAKRELPELSLEYIRSVLLPIYANKGILVKEVSHIENDTLQKLETQWAKKLGFGRNRAVYELECLIRK